VLLQGCRRGEEAESHHRAGSGMGEMSSETESSAAVSFEIPRFLSVTRATLRERRRADLS
jgi:hypothetical protein